MSIEQWVRLATEAPLDKYETYLGMQGFKFAEQFGERGASYVSASGQHVIVPLSKAIDDFEIRLIKLVQDLSRLLDIDRERIARAISSIGFDALKIRTGIGSGSFSVDLDDALDNLHNSYSLVDYSAVFATSDKPVRYIRGRRTNEVSNYLDSVRMGQTEPGSFILTLLLPNVRATSWVDSDEKPNGIGHLVSDALETGLAASKIQTSQQANKKVEFSANFAKALADIVSRSPSVEIGVYNSARRSQSKVGFKRKDEELLREIADKLAPRVETWSRRVNGTVVAVNEPRRQRNGSFIVEAKIGDDQKNLKIPFSRNQRKIIIEAFDRKAEVTLEVDGLIVKSAGGRYTMEDPTDFRLIERGGLT